MLLSIFSGKRSQGNEAPLAPPEAMKKPSAASEMLASHGGYLAIPADTVLRMKDVDMKLPTFVPISKPEAIAAALAGGVIAAAPPGTVAAAVDCYEAVLAELRARAIAHRDASGVT